MSCRVFQFGAVLLLVAFISFGCGSKGEIKPDDPTAGDGTDMGKTGDGGDGHLSGIPADGAGGREGTERDAAADYLFSRIHYEFDRYRITPEARNVLTRHAKVLMENVSWTIRIEGHCDERGTVEYNLALGEKRADSAKQFLTQYGVAADRIRTISYGKEKPVASGSNEAAWAENRRAEFVISR